MERDVAAEKAAAPAGADDSDSDYEGRDGEGGDQVNVDPAVTAQVMAALRAELRPIVMQQLRDELRPGIKQQLRSEVEREVRSQVEQAEKAALAMRMESSGLFNK